MGNLGELAGPTLIMISFLLLLSIAAFLATRYMSGRAGGIMRSRYLRMIDSLPLGRDKGVMLIEAGETYYLLGVTNQSVNLLGTVEKREMEQMDEEEAAGSNGPGLKGLAGRLKKSVAKIMASPDALKKARQEQKEEAELLETEMNQESGMHAEGALPFQQMKAKSVFAVSLQRADADGNYAVPQRDELGHEEPAADIGVKLQRKEDEIDRMMQSIEARTQKLRRGYKEKRNNDEQ